MQSIISKLEQYRDGLSEQTCYNIILGLSYICLGISIGLMLVGYDANRAFEAGKNSVVCQPFGVSLP